MTRTLRAMLRKTERQLREQPQRSTNSPSEVGISNHANEAMEFGVRLRG